MRIYQIVYYVSIYIEYYIYIIYSSSIYNKYNPTKEQKYFSLSKKLKNIFFFCKTNYHKL